MFRLGRILLCVGGWWVACQPISSPAPNPPKLLAADTLQWRHTADSLLALVKTDTIFTDTFLAQAIKLLAQARQPEKWVNAWADRFRYHRDRGGIEYLCPLLENAVQQIWWEDDSHVGRMYLMLGFCLRQLGRNHAAGICYEKARQLSERFGHVTTRHPAGPIYKTLANIKTRLGENEEAEKLFLAALELLRRDTSMAQATANAFTSADIYSDLGIAYGNAGTPQKALKAYDKGLAELQRLRLLEPKDQVRRDNTLGMLLANKAAALAELGQLNEAALTVKAALQNLRPDKYNYRFNALGIQANIWEKMGRDSLALDARRQALRLADLPSSNIEPREVSKLLVAMGWAALRRGEQETAALLAQQALKQLYPHLSATNLGSNPDPAIFDPDPENAVAEALDLKSEALWQQYALRNDAHALALADSTTRLALEMTENLLEVVVYESSKLLSTQQSRRLFGRMLRILYVYHQAGDAHAMERAFTCSEQSKAVLLRQKVSADALLRQAQVSASLAERERDLRDRYTYLKNELFQHLTRHGQPDDSLGMALKQRIFRIEQEQRQTRQTISERYGLNLSQAQVPLTSVAAVRRHLLRPGECWVNYFADPDSGWVYLIYIKHGEDNFIRQPYREAAITDFIQLVNNAKVAENRSADPALWRTFVSQAHGLYRVLLEPALTQPAQRLTLSPDGALSLLPFDILLAQPADPNGPVNYAALDYVGLSMPIRLSLSASLERFYAGQPRRRPQYAYVGFAPEYTDGSLAPVYKGSALVDSMARRLGGRAFCGPQARVDTFLRYASRGAILHFYGHAEASDSFPDYSWMAFSPPSSKNNTDTRVTTNNRLGGPNQQPAFAAADYFLFAHQIYHTWIASDVALLSACRTGVGTVALGEGTLSLARAFQAAGCPATLMSLWEVRDDATASLTQLFLDNLYKGLAKDEALFLAKRDYCQKAPDPFPYFWAGFALTGSPEPVRLPRQWPWYYLSVALTLLTLAVAVWWFFLRKKTF